jgi:hypothetical protein
MSDRLNETIRLIQGLKRHQRLASSREGKEFKGDLQMMPRVPKEPIKSLHMS